MELEKLTITNRDTQESFKVLFNPAEYSIEDANSWKELEKPRRRPELQFTNQTLKKLSMELFFDTYEKNEDVRLYTGKVARLMNICIDDGDGKRPPICEVAWGGADPGTGIFPFVGVLESLKQQFVLFSPNGTPVRARLSVAFKQYVVPADDEKECPKRGSFPVRTHTVRSGETVSSIAATTWRQPEMWRRIADINRIDNPRRLTPGQVLALPAIR